MNANEELVQFSNETVNGMNKLIALVAVIFAAIAIAYVFNWWENKSKST